MDPQKIGALIRRCRTNRHLTQRQLADLIHVSDKAVSKWETGGGCPDPAMLPALAAVFGLDVQVLLSGEIEKNEREQGNMKKLQFYVCRDCGNILTATADAAITCCGNRLAPLAPKPATPSQRLTVEQMDGQWYLSSDHPMTKEHHIAFVAYVGDDTAMLVRQYPEWAFRAQLPPYRRGRLVWYCTQCGAFWQPLTPTK